MRAARRILGLSAMVAIMAAATPAQAWSHQGHILITRLACLRIINDPASPEGLKTFLKAHMKYDMEACKKLAEEEVVGADPKNYQVGIDGASTWPDRVIYVDEGKKPIEPYGTGEAKMHFMDLEFFGKEPAYKADFSNRPDPKDIPRDVKDERWKFAGYVPFRVEEKYTALVAEFAKKEMNPEAAVKELGYLAHYLEDCTQPHHSTIDYKSLSYLAGKVKGVNEIKKEGVGGKEFIDYTVARNAKVNPHGDLEFQLFENADEPRKEWRAEFWKQLTAQIDAQAGKFPAKEMAEAKYDGFAKSLAILYKGYEFLPAVGEIAQAAYATDKFDPKVFFTHEATLNGEKITALGIMARQKALAVLEVEAAIRHAWADAHK